MKRILAKIPTLLVFSVTCCLSVSAQKFNHPGIDQTIEDLRFMKQQVVTGAQPWKDSFDQLKASADLNTIVKPFAHVLRGAFGKPNIGGGELAKNANLAYDCAIIWSITDDKAYAKKAIEILNAWSPVLWDFDYNDAKLLAAWTGHVLCNAAEILKYTDSGWQQKDIDSFTDMLMTVYYPLLRYYYPQANGNWDGAIIQTVMAIGVFTDNREMFRNAVDHFLYSPVNGSLFKYIFPSGQCQESTRDQAHVQLGLGEFAGSARVAYTQGLDLFAVGNCRIGLGYEFTAKFILGEKPQCYGVISERAKEIRDDYEYVYRHYESKGIHLPYVKIAADSVRPKSTRYTLTAFRAPTNQGSRSGEYIFQVDKTMDRPAGAKTAATEAPPQDAIAVVPGQSLQQALDSAARNGKWVIAKAGIHTILSALRIPSGVTLTGEGLGTILFLDPTSSARDAIVNADSDMHDVTIRDLVVEGRTKTDPGTDPNASRSFRNQWNRGGIRFTSNKEGEMKNISLADLTVENCTRTGVFINGATGVNITHCDFTENGASVAPGQKLLHNLLITHCTDIAITNSRLDTSPYGGGIAFDHSHSAKVAKCEIARNAYYGVSISESSGVAISGNLIEANDRSGVMIEFLYKGSDDISISNNKIQYNNGYGLEAYGTVRIKNVGNDFVGNAGMDKPANITKEKSVIMQ